VAFACVMLALSSSARAATAPTFTNPVIPGDHPDPTVMRDGGLFYASATSDSWAPIFPIFRSSDLVNWTQVGAVLPRAPAWATGSFWAPELVRWNGRVFAFYSATERSGPHCIGVATARRPEGPWKDGGRVLCRSIGAIDPAPVTDTDGSHWLVYRAMGPGNGLWAARFSLRILRLVGPRYPLLFPDQPWERGVVEGPTVARVGGLWYLFYAGGSCCSPPCSYSEGVARAPTLRGPYLKDPGNPLLRSGNGWKCAGHGTLVWAGNELRMLHHATRQGDRSGRRTTMLDPIAFGADGWPQIGGDGEPVEEGLSPMGALQTPSAGGFSDAFDGTSLAPGWEWPLFRPPAVRVGKGSLMLSCRGTKLAPAFVARQANAGHFTAVASIPLTGIRGTAAVGIAVHGPGSLLRALELRAGALRSVRILNGTLQVGPAVPAPPGPRPRLAITVAQNGSLSTYASGDGKTYVTVPAGPAAVGPPPTPVALTCRGTGSARFAAVSARPA